jgi:protein-disulfide isomerase
MNQNFHTALAIFIGFSLVAGAIVLRGSLENSPSSQTVTITMEMASRDESVHIYGSAEAQVRIVEFSDLECPFCARLHPILKEIIDTSNGNIAWEYRHLPLASHQDAQTLALASECVAQHAGSEAFFSYTEDILGAIGSAMDDGFYLTRAREYGVDESTMQACLLDPKMLERVTNDVAEASQLGARGTPFNVILGPDGYSQVVPGALPKEQWLGLLQSIE